MFLLLYIKVIEFKIKFLFINPFSFRPLFNFNIYILFKQCCHIFKLKFINSAMDVMIQ